MLCHRQRVRIPVVALRFGIEFDLLIRRAFSRNTLNAVFVSNATLERDSFATLS